MAFAAMLSAAMGGDGSRSPYYDAPKNMGTNLDVTDARLGACDLEDMIFYVASSKSRSAVIYAQNKAPASPDDVVRVYWELVDAKDREKHGKQRDLTEIEKAYYGVMVDPHPSKAGHYLMRIHALEDYMHEPIEIRLDEDGHYVALATHPETKQSIMVDRAYVQFSPSMVPDVDSVTIYGRECKPPFAEVCWTVNR